MKAFYFLFFLTNNFLLISSFFNFWRSEKHDTDKYSSNIHFVFLGDVSGSMEEVYEDNTKKENHQIFIIYFKVLLKTYP